MKGIRKLFFGLILMTLFGVGFKVEAKAEPNVNLEWVDNSYNTITPANADDWEKTTYLRGTMEIVPSDDFPDVSEPTSGINTASFYYTFKIAEDDYYKSPFDKLANLTIEPTTGDISSYEIKPASISIELTTSYKAGDAEPKYTYIITYKDKNGGTRTVSNSVDDDFSIYIDIPKDTVREVVKPGSNNYLATAVYEGLGKNPEDQTITVPTTSTIDAILTIDVLKVKGGAYDSDNKVGDLYYKYDETKTDNKSLQNGFNMFKYEKLQFDSPEVSGELYSLDDWTVDNTNGSIISGSKKIEKVVVSADSEGNLVLKEILNYNGSPVSLSGPVYVTNGKSISLSNFISSDSNSATPVYAKLSSDAQGSATLNPPNELEAINSITITGNNSSGIKKTDGLTITNVDKSTSKADVVVYTDKPTLTKASTSSSGSGTSYKFSIEMPYGVYYTDSSKTVKVNNLSSAVLVFSGKNDTYEKRVTLDTSADDKLTKTHDETLSRKELTNIFRDICKEDHETVSVKAYAYVNGAKDANIVSDAVTFDVYKISLDGSAGASYQVDDTDVSGYFYGISGSSYKVVARGTGSIDKSNSSSEFANITASNGTATISSYGVAGARTLKAAFTTSNSSSMPTPTPTSSRTASEGMDDYDDVPKTGESKADIWILWSVLFVSILGAGFMIWKRFGLVRAIAEADEEVAVAEHKEEVKAKKKEKEDKIKMLKDLRNL